MWEATAVLTAVRRGMALDEACSHLPALEATTKKALRTLGMTKEFIEREYPAEILGSALLMIELDPIAFEHYLEAAIEKFVQRN